MDKSIYYSDNKFTTLKPSTAPVNKIFYLYYLYIYILTLLLTLVIWSIKHFLCKPTTLYKLHIPQVSSK